jgi:hypothetical protein
MRQPAQTARHTALSALSDLSAGSESLGIRTYDRPSNAAAERVTVRFGTGTARWTMRWKTALKALAITFT